MNIVLIGPPGSGKSTQSKLLAEKLGIPAISLGKLLREAEDANTLIGKEAARYTEEGELTPTELIQALTKQRLGQKDSANGFVLDGAPRRVEEAIELDSYLKGRNSQIDKVFLLEVPDEEVIKRLTLRSSLPESKGGGRSDDNLEDIKVRLQEYHDNIRPIILYYEQKNLLVHIDASKSVSGIHKEIISELQL